MGSTVIVALPALDEQVYKVSSEQVPHLTLVHLGDSVSADKLQTIVEFTAHVCTQLSPFYATVDYRGTLGDKNADVLFFENNGWDMARIKEFRHHLLMSDTIKMAYDTADQFDEWTPHLTLGYPETPAHDVADARLHSVRFDRIAVWTGDFEGPEFRLKYEDHAMEVAMSDISTSALGEDAVNELFHYGVKGMHWGVRKEEELADIPRKTVVKARKDAEEFTRAKLFYGEGAGTRRKLIKAKVEQRSSDPQYKKAFDHFVNKTDLSKRADQAKSERRRKNATKSVAKTTRGVKNVLTKSGAPVTVGALAVAGGIKVARDRGLDKQLMNTGARAASNLLKNVRHADEDENVLEHHGVKGMKWGVRNDRGHEGERAKTKTIAKADKKYDKNLSGIKGFINVNNAIANKINPRLDVLNNKPEYKDKDLTKDPALHKKYINDYRTELGKSLDEVGVELGMNASGTKKMELSVVGEGMDTTWEARMVEVKHGTARDVTDGFRILPVFDDNGFITDQQVHPLEEALKHYGTGVEATLEHYGVKGMRWGVTTVDKATKPTVTRQKNSHLVRGAKDVSVSQRKAGTYVKTKGGQRQTASEDAVKAHAGRQKAKKSTTDALTNDELRAVNERLRLEQEFAKLDSKVKRKGQSFVARLFQNPAARQTGADLLKKISDANGSNAA